MGFLSGILGFGDSKEKELVDTYSAIYQSQGIPSHTAKAMAGCR